MKSWAKRLYIEQCSRKETSGIAKILAGLCQLKGMASNTDKGRCPLCLGEVNILLDCLEARNWRMKFLNHELLVMNEVAK